MAKRKGRRAAGGERPFRAGRLQRESSTVRGALYYMLGFGRDDEEKII